MVRAVLLRWLLLAVAIVLTTWLLPDIRVDGGPVTYLWIAVLFTAVNVLLGPLLHLLALPLTALTLGLFALVVNAALLGITAGLSSHLSIDSFGAAVAGALLISVLSALLSAVVRVRPSGLRTS